MTRIGPYALVHLLGEGGMGSVWRAEGPGGPVALKTVRVARPTLVAAMRREIAVLAELRHPGVVRILDHGLHEGAPWYAMELLRGETLRRAIFPSADGTSTTWTGDDEGPTEDLVRAVDVPLAVTLLRRMCGPLAWLHGEGIVHRDLKPDNVIVGTDGWPVLLDFGVLDRFGANESLDALVGPAGTLAYMSPEQARGDAVDPRADLWALGCLLFQVLTGAVPFPATSLRALRQRHTEPAALALAPEATRPLLQTLLAVDPTQRLGSAEAVADALLSLGAQPEPLPGPPARGWLYRPRFVGRAEELGVLKAAVEALPGRSERVLVSGESGAGKSRLLREALREAGRRRIPVIVASCAQDRPLEPLRALVEGAWDAARGVAGEVFSGRSERLRTLSPRIRPVGGAPVDEPLAASVAAVLGAAGPVVCVVDDLQWADELLLDTLAATAGRPVAVLGSARSEETHPALARWCEASGLRTVALPRLDEAGVGALTADLLGVDAAPASLVRALGESAGGNPFFVGEVLRAAVDDGRLRRDARGRWAGVEAVAAGAPVWPRRLVEVVIRRLADLPREARALAEALAVGGRSTPPAWLPPLASLPELLRRRIVDHDEDGVRFVHDKLREALLLGLPPERLRLLHADLAARLSALGDAAPPALLAEHLEEAGDPARARREWLRAAGPDGAAPGALHALARAAELTGPGEERVALLRRAVATTRRSGVSREALDCGARLLAESPTPADAERWLDLLVTAGRVEELPGEAARLAPLLDGRPEGRRARCHVGVALHRLGRVEEGVAVTRAVLAEALEAGDEETTRTARQRLALQLGEHEGPAAQRARAEEVVAEARRSGRPEDEGVAQHNLGVTLSQIGDLGPAEACLRRALALAHATHRVPLLASGSANLGLVLLHQGRWAEAVATAREGTTFAEASGVDRTMAYTRVVAGLIRAEREPAEGVRALREVLPVVEALQEPVLLGGTLAYLALAERRSGDPAGARSSALRAKGIIGTRDVWFGALAGTAELLARRDAGEALPSEELRAWREHVDGLRLLPGSQLSRCAAELFDGPPRTWPAIGS